MRHTRALALRGVQRTRIRDRGALISHTGDCALAGGRRGRRIGRAGLHGELRKSVGELRNSSEISFFVLVLVGEQKIRKPTFPGQEKREKGEYRETGRPRNRVFRLNLFINKFGLFMPPLNR